ncbi:MAG: DUF3301 domain-containing protein [Gammaproteobacteria bacterium]|nr:DUF3301 domain-containing protein [Gammaproteobacteria bacterium]
MSDLLLLGVLGGALWYWGNTIRCKEIARRAGLDACQRASVQFLDDTVEKKKIWLRRNNHGRMQLCRLYFFEFTSDGAQRYAGRIVMLGHKTHEVEMDAYRIPGSGGDEQ